MNRRSCACVHVTRAGSASNADSPGGETGAAAATSDGGATTIGSGAGTSTRADGTDSARSSGSSASGAVAVPRPAGGALASACGRRGWRLRRLMGAGSAGWAPARWGSSFWARFRRPWTPAGRRMIPLAVPWRGHRATSDDARAVTRGRPYDMLGPGAARGHSGEWPRDGPYSSECAPTGISPPRSAHDQRPTFWRMAGGDRRDRVPQPETTSRSRVASLRMIGPSSPHTTMSSIRAPNRPSR